MRKIFAVAVIALATFGTALAQTPSASTDEAPNMGIAPKFMNGPGRADVRVLDQSGNPVPNAKVLLESHRTDGFLCESWGTTNEHGIIVLPPLHMGELTLKIKAPGFKAQDIHVENSALAEPVRVTLVHK